MPSDTLSCGEVMPVYCIPSCEDGKTCGHFIGGYQKHYR